MDSIDDSNNIKDTDTTTTTADRGDTTPKTAAPPDALVKAADAADTPPPEITESEREAFDNTPDGVGVMLPLTLLHRHPRNHELLPAATAVQDEKLLADLTQTKGFHRDLIVCGYNCASPRGTLLDGNRRHEKASLAGITMGRVVFRSGLSPLDETILILSYTTGDQYARKLNESDLMNIETRLREEIGARKGQRTDLAVTVKSIDGTEIELKGETDEIIAKIVKQPFNSVKTRKAIATSPVKTKAAVKALAAGIVKPTALVTTLREAAKEHDVANDSSQIEAAKAAVDANLAKKLVPKKHARVKSTKASKPKTAPASAGRRTAKVVCLWDLKKGKFVAVAELLGQQFEVAVHEHPGITPPHIKVSLRVLPAPGATNADE